MLHDTRASGTRHSLPCNPPHQVRVQDQPNIKVFNAEIENRISRSQAGFSLLSYYIIRRPHHVVPTVPLPVPQEVLGHAQSLSVGIDGIHHISSTDGSTEDERPPALGL